MAISSERGMGMEEAGKPKAPGEKEVQSILKGYYKNLQALRQEAANLPDKGKVMAEMFIKGLEKDRLRFPGSSQGELQNLIESFSEEFLQ